MDRIEAIRQREERWREQEERAARSAIANVGGAIDFFAAYTTNGDVAIFAERHGREIIAWTHKAADENDALRWLRFAQAEAERLNAEAGTAKEVER